jgi:arabinose-5-phosphate isomerase
MSDLISEVKREMKLAADAIERAADKIDARMEKAVGLIYSSPGKTVVTGMGKTGLIGRKISATLASTGSTSIFLHAAEGIHGDLGILHRDDVVLAVSYSGNTQELLAIIPYIKFLQIPIIAITGNPDSQLAKSADVVLDSSVPSGSEPFNLVPTASTTVALAIGDALAVALLKKRNFQIQDLARFHPGGTIGKKLLLKVEDLMHQGKENPLVQAREKMKDVILTMTEKGLGCTNVVNEEGTLIGIITDGDLRRLMTKGGDILECSAQEAMTKEPKSISPESLAVAALTLMEDHKITMLPVTDVKRNPIGILHMHDLIRAGVVG